MSDLVERLRDRKIITDTNPWLRADDICVEAADRIEALEAENERLREALRDVTDYGDLAAVRIARAALETKHD